MLKWHRYRKINLSNKVITMLVWRQCPSSEAHCCTDVSRHASPCFQQLRWKKGSGFLPWVIRRASFYLGLCSVLSTPGHHLCSDFLKPFYVNSSLVFLSKCFLREYSCVPKAQAMTDLYLHVSFLQRKFESRHTSLTMQLLLAYKLLYVHLFIFPQHIFINYLLCILVMWR